MPSFIVSQTVDINILYVVEAENEEDALYQSLDRTKIIEVDHLSWEKPHFSEPTTEASRFLTNEELEVYQKAGIL